MQFHFTIYPLPEYQTKLIFLCSDHDEKPKLFCETDQKLVCVICRDDEKHRGHEFKPIEEADSCHKTELNGASNFLLQDNSAMDSLSKLRDLEIKNTQREAYRAERLRAEIHSQVEEMHSFLSRKEKEVAEELEGKEADALEVVKANEALIESRLETRKKTEATPLSALDIPGADSFLQWWSEEGHLFMLELKETDDGNRKKQLYESRAKDLWVATDSFSLGAYETQLLYFMWKEMLRIIRSGPERLTPKPNDDPYLKPCADGSGVRQLDRQSGYLFKTKEPAADYRGTAVSEETFGTGQHYPEVDVRKKLDWGVGVKGGETDQIKVKEEKQLFLKHDKGYAFTDNGTETAVNPSVKPRKTGLYLDCESKRVSFHSADTMSLIHSANCSFFPSSCRD
ncbi:zinc-binding protein A33-like [Scleropages formosus]|uniref:zinc-binding protein A33-like n=1 Tax=Scleropages formosus TaxID=113540 RepID=UPI000878EDCF|nr:zinc-binding protein A33-like [Scleropages formosus]